MIALQAHLPCRTHLHPEARDTLTKRMFDLWLVRYGSTVSVSIYVAYFVFLHGLDVISCIRS